MIVDFHSHTRESDGTLTPQALADFMGERGVEVFSISDHDTMSAYGKFTPPPDARVVTGVEINTTYRGNEVHLLGYGMPADAPELLATIERNRDARRVRAQRMVDQLQRAGYGITYDEVLKEAPDAKAIGRPHVAKALIAKGLVPDIDWAFRHLLRTGNARLRSFAAHHAAGSDRAHYRGRRCASVSASRAPEGSRADRRTRAERPARAGSLLSAPRCAKTCGSFATLAKRYGLVMTAGMDFHDIRYHTRGRRH